MQNAKRNQGEFMTVMNFIFWILCVIFLAGFFGKYVFIILPVTIGVMLLGKHYLKM